jgi:CheY-like chemotaxis protein
MPGMSGLELLPKTKAIRPDVPIIMITAYSDADTKRRAVTAISKVGCFKVSDIEIAQYLAIFRL